MKSTFTILLVIGYSLGCHWQLTAATDSTAVPASAQVTPAPPPSSPAQRSAAELEKLAEPIALHPDPLISIILPAAAYPLEIVRRRGLSKTRTTSRSWTINPGTRT